MIRRWPHHNNGNVPDQKGFVGPFSEPWPSAFSNHHHHHHHGAGLFFAALWCLFREVLPVPFIRDSPLSSWVLSRELSIYFKNGGESKEWTRIGILCPFLLITLCIRRLEQTLGRQIHEGKTSRRKNVCGKSDKFASKFPPQCLVAQLTGWIEESIAFPLP